MVIIYKILQSKITALIFTIFTFVLFSLPSKAFENVQTEKDKLAHSLLFFGITLLWLFSTKASKWIYISCICYGVFVELCQANLPAHFHRSGDWLDAVYDALGVLIAGLCFYLFTKYKKIVFPR
jgi:VanZ family protein